VRASPKLAAAARARVSCYRKRATLHSAKMLWFTIFFLVILKIPAAYLGYVIWWAVKDPPEPGTDPACDRVSPGGGEDGGSPVWQPSSGGRWVPGRRPGPHGSPERRPRPVLAPTRAEKRS
jgi:hypothetical protein